jgi:transposase
MRHYQKISAIGAIWLSPHRRHLGLATAWYPDQNIRQEQVQSFLQSLHRRLPGRLIVLWDRAKPHIGRHLKTWLARQHRLVIEPLPSYAPDLNAVDHFWADLKGHDLANHGLLDLHRLQIQAGRSTRRIRQRQDLLRAFVRHTHLPLRLPSQLLLYPCRPQ